MTCICTNALSVNHILFEHPITSQLFQKNGYDFMARNIVKDILYNIDVIASIIKLTDHSHVGISLYNLLHIAIVSVGCWFFFFVCVFFLRGGGGDLKQDSKS